MEAVTHKPDHTTSETTSVTRAGVLRTEGDVPTYGEGMTTTARDVLADHIGGDEPYNLADAAIMALHKAGYEIVHGPYDPDAELLTDLNRALDVLEVSKSFDFYNDAARRRVSVARFDLLHRHQRMPCQDEACEFCKSWRTVTEDGGVLIHER